jgi:hypothetical protein
MESKEYIIPSLNPAPTRVPIPTQIPEVPLPQVHYQAQEVKAAHKAEEESRRIEDGKKKDEKRNKVVNNSSHAVDKAVGKASHKENQVPDTEEHNVEETPKKSYASIVRTFFLISFPVMIPKDSSLCHFTSIFSAQASERCFRCFKWSC